MPVYNREELVADAIESVLNQTFTDFEFIIVDDGSTDNTMQILKAYAEKDKRIRLIAHDKNCGVGCGRNTAQRNARGQFLAIMDSDDIMSPTRLEKQVTVMQENPQIAVLNGAIKRYDEKEFLSEQFQKPRLMDAQYSFPMCMFFMNCYANVSSMVRHDFVKEHNIIYDETLSVAEDYDYWMQIILSGGHLRGLLDTLVYVRRASNSAMASPRIVSDTLNVKKRVFKNILGENEIPLKWNYSILERCDILKQLVNPLTNRHGMDKNNIVTYYKKVCYPEIEDKVFVEHPHWSGVLALLDDNRIQRTDVADGGEYLLKDDMLFVKWDRYAPEKFVLSANGIYEYISPDERVVRFVHDIWQDDVRLKGEKACRRSVKDCARILVEDNHKLIVKWDNYGTETFVRNPKETAYYRLKK